MGKPQRNLILFGAWPILELEWPILKSRQRFFLWSTLNDGIGKSSSCCSMHLIQMYVCSICWRFNLNILFFLICCVMKEFMLMVYSTPLANYPIGFQRNIQPHQMMQKQHCNNAIQTSNRYSGYGNLKKNARFFHLINLYVS